MFYFHHFLYSKFVLSNCLDFWYVKVSYLWLTCNVGHTVFVKEYFCFHGAIPFLKEALSYIFLKSVLYILFAIIIEHLCKNALVW